MSLILAILAAQAAPQETRIREVQQDKAPASPTVQSGGPSQAQGIGIPSTVSPEEAYLRLSRPATTVVRPTVTGSGIGDGGAVAARRLDTVIERDRPDYDPIGIRTGSFLIFPEVSSSVGYDSNVYRQTSGASDVFGRVRGAAQVRSNLSRNALILDGFIDQRVYSKYTSDNALTYQAHTLGRLDFARGDWITLEAQHNRSIVDRGAAGEILITRRPIRYDVTTVSIDGRKTLSRLILSLGGAITKSDYDDAETPAGAPLDQQFRDFTLYRIRGDAGYALPAGPELFVSMTGEARRFRLDRPPIDRDAHSVEILGGIRSDITPLLRGQIGVGFLYADFKDPTIRSRSGLGLNVRLDYLVTPLTTVKLSARREFQNVASVVAPAILVTEGRLGVDHELLRNVILSASAALQSGDYLNSTVNARRLALLGSAQWLVNRRIRVDFDIGYQQRTGTGRSVNRDFDQTRASVGIAYRL